MSERRNYAELWVIGFKSMLFLYVISQSYASNLAMTPWYILVVLLYLSVNVSVYIFKSRSIQPYLMLLAVLVVAASSFYIHPLLFMLLPVNLYELASLYVRRSWMILIPCWFQRSSCLRGLLWPMFLHPFYPIFILRCSELLLTGPHPIRSRTSRCTVNWIG